MAGNFLLIKNHHLFWLVLNVKISGWKSSNSTRARKIFFLVRIWLALSMRVSSVLFFSVRNSMYLINFSNGRQFPKHTAHGHCFDCWIGKSLVSSESNMRPQRIAPVWIGKIWEESSRAKNQKHQFIYHRGRRTQHDNHSILYSSRSTVVPSHFNPIVNSVYDIYLFETCCFMDIHRYAHTGECHYVEMIRDLWNDWNVECSWCLKYLWWLCIESWDTLKHQFNWKSVVSILHACLSCARSLMTLCLYVRYTLGAKLKVICEKLNQWIETSAHSTCVNTFSDFVKWTKQPEVCVCVCSMHSTIVGCCCCWYVLSVLCLIWHWQFSIFIIRKHTDATINYWKIQHVQFDEMLLSIRHTNFGHIINVKCVYTCPTFIHPIHTFVYHLACEDVDIDWWIR